MGKVWSKVLITHCKRGHEFTPDNTSFMPSGSRRCITCRREAERLPENVERGKRRVWIKKPESELYGGMTKIEYIELHRQIRKAWGKPTHCEICDVNEGRLEWSNTSGKYLKERSDWRMLCTSCHRKLDLRKSHCPKGHEFTKENSRFTKKDHRYCYQCRKSQQRAFIQKRAESRREYDASR